MAHTHPYWRTDRPSEGFATADLTSFPGRKVHLYVPEQYEARHAYPLLVLLHGHGGCERAAVRLAPQVSRRNYVAVSLPGPSKLAYGQGWDSDAGAVADYVRAAVARVRRTYHVHSQRVYLVGFREGATAAYRAAARLGDFVAGVAAFNGKLPAVSLAGRKVLLGHGVENRAVCYGDAAADLRALTAAGADARLIAYPTADRLHPAMLRDLDRWVMGHINGYPAA